MNLLNNKIISKPKKVLVLGSGALKIGEAGEFDYSGSQAIKALKQEGIRTVLINPNIATIQTSEHLADRVYFLPVNRSFTEKVIEKERPDSILLSFGGQTALNCGLSLEKEGILEKYQVQVLGTPIKTVENTEDRELFNKKLKEINCSFPKSQAVSSLKEAEEAAERIGFPVMTRNGYALGGKGSGTAYNLTELKKIVKKSLTITSQILIEEYLEGWKEIEYEVVRDRFDNCITVCNMENMDPMGIHTGESIVIAPSQTLDNEQYHLLREVSIKVVRHLGVIGECNIQFALDSKSSQYRIIEVNARLSRSSALASKATGYPLAFAAAKLALGHSLTDLKNSITQATTACFEPALDYLTIKIPRWDLKKFRMASHYIGSEMKSVGEVMAIGRSFEEALQKALRMLNTGAVGLVGNENFRFKNIEQKIKKPTPERIFAISEALKRDIPIEKINQWSKIDKWFLYKLKNIVDLAEELERADSLTEELILKAKQHGFSDEQIAKFSKKQPEEIRKFRQSRQLTPFVKQIDTLAAEYPAKTNYLYLTYHGSENDISQEREKEKVIVLGSGAYCIGSSVEFDWCCVNTVKTLKNLGYETIMINCNPETVSTDYDECGKLYFEELTFERVLDIYQKEKPLGVIVSMGGQAPNNLSVKLDKAGVKILGTKAQDIDRAENRHKFSQLLDKLNISQPQWQECPDIISAKKFADKTGYPVLIRPSYVLSGSAMNVALEENELEYYLSKAVEVSPKHPVVITKFILNAKEIEVDAVAKKGKLIKWIVSEHIENAGVHSGDATIVLPAQKVYSATLQRIRQITEQTAQELNITGPFNIQFLAKDNQVKVIECNLRAARTMPFVCKTIKTNLIQLAAYALVDQEPDSTNQNSPVNHIGIKAPQFSFSRLSGADPILGVEMASTGEVACFGDTIEEAFLKSLLSTGFKIAKQNILLSLGGAKNKSELLEFVKKLKNLGYIFFTTEGTFRFLKNYQIQTNFLYKVSENREPNAKTYLEGNKLGLVINIPKEGDKTNNPDSYFIRRTTVDFNIPLITNLQTAKLLFRALTTLKKEDLKIKAWDEY